MSDPMRPSEGDYTPCGARTRSGAPCQAHPVEGSARCRMHGGAAPQVKARIERERLEAEAAAAVELWGGRADVHPAEALLELVQRKAMEVQFWQRQVQQVQQGNEGDLTWGVSREKIGGHDSGVTREAKPHVTLQLLHRAEAQLAEFSAAALRAGVDERMVALAENVAGQFRSVMEAVLADPRLGITADTHLRNAVVADALQDTAHH